MKVNVKEFIKKHIFIIAIVGAVIFLAVFLSFLFKKVGDDVYIIEVNGEVKVGNTSDLHSLKNAEPGKKLTVDDIIVTNDKSSCVVAYSKKSAGQDNFLNIGENSQVMLFGKNAQGGYNFFLTYGSIICNMSVERSYRTNISSKLFNLYVDGTIVKTTYDSDETMGQVFTFDGNPQIQIIQPSGSVSRADKLLKNSVCAVTETEDGSIGFGYLNVGFGLNQLTAQDLRIMSGVAGQWSEKISFSVNEIEQAYQTAADLAKWTATEPVVTSFAQTEMSYISSEATTVPDGFDRYDDISSYDEYDKYYNETEYEGTRQALDPNVDVYYTAFIRQTVNDNTSVKTESVTTVPDDVSTAETGRTSRTSAPYDTIYTISGSEIHSSETTTPYSYNTASQSSLTTAEHTYTHVPSSEMSSVTTSPYETGAATTTETAAAPYQYETGYNIGEKPSIVTDGSYQPANPNSVYTVIFSYNDGGVEYWSIQLVRYGHSAIAPDEPIVPGKTFRGWDRDFSYVSSNMEIRAVFSNSGAVNDAEIRDTVVTPVKDTYTVNFYVENKLWRTLTVRRGETAVMKDVPVSKDDTLVFCGWSDALTNVRSDKNVFALFKTK